MNFMARLTVNKPFLSTLSLRRATAKQAPRNSRVSNFYPRSPCGERLIRPVRFMSMDVISIHALLAESDHCIEVRLPMQNISIHALLAESDDKISNQCKIDQQNFYPRSPCGERQPAERHASSQQEFLSTLSLRRATAGGGNCYLDNIISIHALLAESDALGYVRGCFFCISIHALLAESDYHIFDDISGATGHFYPRSPCGERLKNSEKSIYKYVFLSTLSLRRATHYDNYNLHCVEISIHALLAESDRTQSASLSA